MGQRIIGLGYKARSGKDAVGDFLVAHYGFRKTAFAESLKEACRNIFHLDNRHLYGELKEKKHHFWGTTPRDILQRVGTEAMRQNFDNDIWVKSCEYRIKKNPRHWVICDVRFPNEAEAIKSWGGEVFRIDRSDERSKLIADGTIKPKSGLSAEAKQHASETAMDDYEGWDGVIVNDGTIEDLYRRACTAARLPWQEQLPL